MVNLTEIINQLHDALAAVESQQFGYPEATNWKRVLKVDGASAPVPASPIYVRIWEDEMSMKPQGASMRTIHTVMIPDEVELTAEITFAVPVNYTDFLEAAQVSASDICASGLAADIRLESVAAKHPPAQQGSEEGTTVKLTYNVIFA